MFTIADKVLIAALAILTVFSYSLAGGGRMGTGIRIEVAGKPSGSYSLSADREIGVNGVLGVSNIKIHGGRASFRSSPCKNKLCIHQGEVGRQGQMAACLPNKVVVRVTGGEGEYDVITR